MSSFDIIKEEEVLDRVIRYPACLVKFYDNVYDVKDKRYLNNHFAEPIPQEIRMSKESIYSSSFLDDAEKTSQLILKLFPSAKVITDATANVGCNTINFAKHFSYVNSIEKDPVEFTRLVPNIIAYGIRNVSVYNEDYTNVLEDLKQDVVFIDAPFGGEKSKYFEKLVLCLSGIRIDDIANYLIKSNKAKMVVLKTPGNVWLSNLKYPKRKTDFYRNMAPFYTLWFVSNDRLPEVESKIIFEKIKF